MRLRFIFTGYPRTRLVLLVYAIAVFLFNWWLWNLLLLILCVPRRSDRKQRWLSQRGHSRSFVAVDSDRAQNSGRPRPRTPIMRRLHVPYFDIARSAAAIFRASAVAARLDPSRFRSAKPGEAHFPHGGGSTAHSRPRKGVTAAGPHLVEKRGRPSPILLEAPRSEPKPGTNSARLPEGIPPQAKGLQFRTSPSPSQNHGD